MSKTRAKAPPITQAELVAYRRLAARLKLLEADVSERKRDLIARVRARAAVEPGRWLPQVLTRESRHFSAEIVERAFGKDSMLEVYAGIPPTVTYIFGVIEEESS